MTTLAWLQAGVVIAIFVRSLVARVLDRQGQVAKRLRIEISLVPPRLVLEVEQRRD